MRGQDLLCFCVLARCRPLSMCSINICGLKEVNFARLIERYFFPPLSVLARSMLAEPQRDARAHAAGGWAWEALSKYLSDEAKAE